MKISIILAFTFFFWLNCFSQKANSIAKYSYYLYGHSSEFRITNGIKQNRLVLATCFFVKKNDKIYLIGTAHTLTGLAHIGFPRDSFFPDTFYVKLPNKKSGKYEDFGFSIVNIKKTVDQNLFYKKADIYAIRLNIPDRYSVNTVNNLIKEKDLYKTKVDSLVMYGFSEKDKGVKQRVQFNPLSYSIAKLIESEYETVSLYTIKSGIVGAGYSGAPLFAFTNGGKASLHGVCIGSVYERVAFVQIKDILSLIKTL